VRIGIVTQRVGLNDGQGRVNYEIAAEALRRGHKVVLFCEQIEKALADRDDVCSELMASPAWLPTQLLKDQLFAWRSHRRLSLAPDTAPAEGARACDALLANGFVTWARADVNAVHFVHSSWQQSPHHPWRERRTMTSLYRQLYTQLNSGLERGAFRRSPAIVAVSNKVRQELLQIGVPPSAITTIVNAVDADEFHPGRADRSQFGLPQGPVIGLFAGDLRDSRKNLGTALRAIVSVPNMHLAVAGGHDGTHWQRLGAELGVADRVHFVGFQRNMPELMRAVDLFVFPSRYEPFGLVILEALASGLPVVTAQSAGGAELVTPQVGVVLEDCDDVPGLAQTLQLLESSPERRTAMATAARAVALQHSWPEMAARYVDLLESAANKRHVA
jgi:glycosyltransferase involved in cell wall biosynthesis